MGAVRKGIGRLVASCDQPPLVVPFVHSGMEEVMPRGKVLPAFGKEVRFSSKCGRDTLLRLHEGTVLHPLSLNDVPCSPHLCFRSVSSLAPRSPWTT